MNVVKKTRNTMLTYSNTTVLRALTNASETWALRVFSRFYLLCKKLDQWCAKPAGLIVMLSPHCALSKQNIGDVNSLVALHF
ncbi:hypothetical protein RB195_023683 [Necator americanus]|uniref:Uncharacterized protein n=1 Tax=Necator americanus TaxID=51031 RepID=A0ABR1EK68_NECAM